MKRIAILIEDLFNERELIYPYYRLLEEGFEVHLVGPKKDAVYTSKSGLTEKSTHASNEILAEDYDGVVIPAGKWHNLTNTGNRPLKLYTIYAPAQHPHGTVHETKAEAEAEHGL